MWQHQLPDLAQDDRVVAYDLRGYGDSDLPAGSFTHHDDLVAVLDALGVDKATLVGCSIGGMLALDATLVFADRIDKLVLVGSGMSGYEWSAEFRELWRKTVGTTGDDLDAAAAAEVKLWVVGPDRSADAVDPELLELATTMSRHALGREEQLEHHAPQQLDPPALGRLAEVTAPTLVVTGDADVPEIHVIADHLVAGIPGAVRVAVPDAGHLLPLEHPAEFSRVVRDFIRSR